MPSVLPASQIPARFLSGTTPDPVYSPLGDCGAGNPFFYQVLADDFNFINVPAWTGTLTAVPGDGGLAALAGTVSSSPSFTLPATGSNPPGTTQSTKKMFFVIRMMLTTAASAWNVGLGTLTDGLVVQGTPTLGVVTLVNAASAGNSPSGAAVTNTFPNIQVPTVVSGQFFDVAIEIDRYQNLSLYMGPRLVGWMPQSGTGYGPGSSDTFIQTRGRVYRNYNFLAQNTSAPGWVQTNPIMFTLAPLGALLNFTGQVDFVGVLKER
jgi:hypothetical protein